MTEKDAPRVKLPDMMPRKPVVPGPNSWAQSKQQQQQSTVSNDLGGVRVTHRDKYENKPMPRPPAETTQNAYLQAKTYIQPAIPLVNPVSSMQTYKNRAVTDPIAPKPLFAGRKLSVTQLRKRYSGPKTKDDEIPKEEAKATNESFPIVGLNSEKAAQVLGLIPAIEDKRNMALASAPTAAVPDVYRESSDNPMGRTGSPVRQVQSTPVPTRRYLRENDLPTPKSVEVDKDTKQQSNEDLKVEEHGPTGLGDRTLLSGMLQPPRVGTHGNVGGVNLVEGIGMHRVESFRGVIENASTPGGNEKEMSSGSIRDLSQPGTAGTQHFVELRSPAVYSPSNYGGVWENDPAVVS